MGKNRKGRDTGRMSGPFLALPHVVLDSPAYLNLSHPAKVLLIEIARQCYNDNNGRLLASRAYLKKRGWTSSDTINKALKDLIDSKLIHQTVKGHRPNKASWFAVTWRTLDRIPGYDAGAFNTFERGSFANGPLKNASLKPSHGQVVSQIGPQDGLGKESPRPSDGPSMALSNQSPRPPDGHHLEKPSAVDEVKDCQQPGNYIRLTKTVDGRDWLPVDVVERKALPLSVTQKALKHLDTLPNSGPVALVAIQSARGAGVTLEQLTAWADPHTVVCALSGGTRHWQDLWTETIGTTQRHLGSSQSNVEPRLIADLQLQVASEAEVERLLQ